MPSASEILINIVAKNSGLKKTLDESTRDVKKFGSEVEKTSGKIGALGNIMQGVFQGIGQAAFNLAGRALGALVGEIGKSITAASNLNETMSKVGAVFGQSAQEVLDWSKDSATAFGLTRQEALEAAASLGNMFIQMGEGQEQAAVMSQDMVELAADIASFNNVSGGAEAVLDNMAAAFRGEYDALQKYIPTINAAAVEQQALAETGKESAKQLTALDKALATQTLIMQGAGVAVGDFARTIDGVANQTRILEKRLGDFRAQFGAAFTPIYGAILQGLNQLITQIMPYGEGIIQSLATGMAHGLIYIIQIMGQIRQIFAYYLQAHSPPRLLPDLAVWGAAAMNAYLEGWTAADFGILSSLGSSIEGILRSFVGAGKLGETSLVSTIFGSQRAISAAIDEFRRLGTVSAGSIDAIRRAAGPAGDSIAGLVESYFELSKASKAAADAQRELTDVTARYDKLISPLDTALDALGARQAELRDAARKDELEEALADPTTSWSERQRAALELQQLELERQKRAVESERDVAVDAVQDKVDATTKEQEAAQEKYDQQKANLDQQVHTNQLLGEEAALRERLAAEGLAEQKRALAELEAEQRKADAANKERLAELERIYQAQLNYNLQIADTPGKIALLKTELGRYSEGSAEYYGILTQIAALEQQLAKERDKAGADGGLLPPILPPVGALDVPSWANDLSAEIKKEMDAAFGTGGVDPMAEFKKHFEGTVAGAPKMSEDLKDLADALKTFGEAIIGVTPSLQALLKAFGLLPKEAEKGSGGAATATDNNLAKMTASINGWTALTTGDWQGFWNAYKEYAAETQTDTNDDFVVSLGDMLGHIKQWGIDTGAAFGETFTDWTTRFTTWLGDILKTISDFDLGPGAESMLFSFWTGLSDYWNETIAPWFAEKLKWVKSFWSGVTTTPGVHTGGGGPSEQPKYLNPNDPRMQGFSSGVPVTPLTLAAASLGSSAATDNSVNFAPGSIAVNVAGGTYAQGRDVGQGILDELRSKGVRA